MNNSGIMKNRNSQKDRYDKVLKFIEIAVLSQKKVRYRDVMRPKQNKKTKKYHPIAKGEL